MRVKLAITGEQPAGLEAGGQRGQRTQTVTAPVEPKTAPHPTATEAWACPSLGCPPHTPRGPAQKGQGGSVTNGDNPRDNRRVRATRGAENVGPLAQGGAPEWPRQAAARTRRRPGQHAPCHARRHHRPPSEQVSTQTHLEPHVCKGPLPSPSGCRSRPCPCVGSASPTETWQQTRPSLMAAAHPTPSTPERLFPCPGSSPSRTPVSTRANSPRPPVALGSKGRVLKVKPPRSTPGQARDTPAPSLPESHRVRPHLLFSHKVIRPRARPSHAGSPVQVPGLGSPDSPGPAATPRHTQQRHEDRGHRGPRPPHQAGSHRRRPWADLKLDPVGPPGHGPGLGATLSAALMPTRPRPGRRLSPP